MKTIFRILILLMFTLMLYPVSAQKLKGRITSLADSYFSVREEYGKMIKGSKLKDSLYHDQMISFDQKGNVDECIEYYFDGTIYCLYKGATDRDDNNSESIYIRLDPEVTSDKKPFIIESVRFSWGERYKMSYQNDSKGLPVEETVTDFMGHVILKVTIKRDEKGNSLEDDFSNGTFNQYKYDSHENRTEWIYRSANSNVIVTNYTFDSFGNIIEMHVNNYFKSTYKFHYDNYTFTYKYDNKGNWFERTDYDNGIPQRMVERKIVYAL